MRLRLMVLSKHHEQWSRIGPMMSGHFLYLYSMQMHICTSIFSSYKTY